MICYGVVQSYWRQSLACWRYGLEKNRRLPGCEAGGCPGVKLEIAQVRRLIFLGEKARALLRCELGYHASNFEPSIQIIDVVKLIRFTDHRCKPMMTSGDSALGAVTMLSIFAQVIYESTRVYPAENSSVARDWRLCSSHEDEKRHRTNKGRKGQGREGRRTHNSAPSSAT